MRSGSGVLRFGFPRASPAARLAMLDRDGVLNVDHGHVYRPDDTEWIPGVADAIRALRHAGYAVVIVTNRPDIAKALYSEDQFAELMQFMVKGLLSEGATIDAVYYCPHYSSEGVPPYRVDCPCRKPKPGMLLRALQDALVTPDHSLKTGDKPTDVEAARTAGVPGYQFMGGDLREFVRRLVEHPHPPTRG